ncbi:S46 family peptidase [Vitiosangium sp. GDMCC 1.1324]|uniref:S46 family peptidase n=1 Tax=Vitiosangium sp. (strain GDMCC 1.1324) TaxID=2138576 RepID=UPI000D3D59DC|nr:S46 family peptidase [Vitiosangium sp. GDMCC 1.1324]PTL80597.1 S46 family peptidase [Vitiosangium sp. GDMCC 1.1324]
MTRLLPVLFLLAAGLARADEGMWTFNNFPSELVKARYGFAPSPEWLKKVRLSAARIAGGCSASFVSPNGLVMTNHHCVRECVQQLSTPQSDFIVKGFYAATAQQEKQCPAFEVNKLVDISDVTDAVMRVVQGKEGAAFRDAQRAEIARLEKACATAPDIRCDVVTLYQGGMYNLYKYQRFQDVRLVFAPEEAIAFFGGDPDNFEFPRYDYDVSFVRVYQDGKPAKLDDYFRWSPQGAQPGELTFVAGHPGGTSRLLTVAQLQYQRDYALPERLVQLAQLRGLLDEFQQRGPEFTRISNNLKFGVENSYKALVGRREALVNREFFATKVAEEQKLRDWVKADPERQKRYGQAWDNIARATDTLRDMRIRLRILEQGAGTGSDLFGYARQLVRAAEEQAKPNEQRLEEYAEARKPELEQQLFSPAPVYPKLEEALLTFYLTKLREQLGPDDPVVKKVLGKQSPQALARKAVAGTRLASPQVRRQLYQGGAAAVRDSKDPMLELVRSLDEEARAIRKRYEDQVDSVIDKNGELIARARFEAYGTSIYPDATFTLRLSFGQVKGFEHNGKQVEPLTRIAGLFERATGEDPFRLPPSWLQARPRLDLQTPFNFVSTNDIIGGNSGSPIFNKDAEIVGIVFDGNIYSLGGEYGFDESLNRTVSVHSQGILEGLRKVYNARRLLDELGQGGGG